MTPPPAGPRGLSGAAAAQTGWIVAGTIVSGFAYLAAILLSGRVVGTWDIAAAAIGCATTGATALIVCRQMLRAGNGALVKLAARRAPAETRRGLPAVVARDPHQQPPSADPPDYTGHDVSTDAARRAAQTRVDRARPARHILQDDGR